MCWSNGVNTRAGWDRNYFFEVGTGQDFFITLSWDLDRNGILLWEWDGTGVKILSRVTQAYITETQEAYPHFWNERIKNVENNIMLLLIPKGDIC